MRYSSWDEIENLTAAELELKRCAEKGIPCKLGAHDEIPPEPVDWTQLEDNRHIRAEVLRCIILRKPGCNTTEKGVDLKNAYISGQLDLSNCEVQHPFVLDHCVFNEGINLEDSNWKEKIKLTNCSIPYITASGISVDKYFDLLGTTIRSIDRAALDLQDGRIHQNLALDAARIYGLVDLIDLQVDRQFTCKDATFQLKENNVEFYSDGNRVVMDLQGARIHTAIFKAKHIAGGVDLNSSHIENFKDDQSTWAATEHLKLDGFTYTRLYGAVSAAVRSQWLERGEQHGFYPQPYKQLAKTLHEMGHETDAESILYILAKKSAKEQRKDLYQKIVERAEHPHQPKSSLRLLLRLFGHILWNFFLRRLVGYGRKPFRSILVLLFLILCCWIISLKAWEEGSFAPNSDVILSSSSWEKYEELRFPYPYKINPADDWSNSTIQGRDWESFKAIAYAADIVIPIINFGQTEAWAPSTTRGPWGKRLWWSRWILTTAGWIVTALGAAALTGIIRRE
ncbi:hypothetical protein [Epibacterium ulvae]|uniref:hypothetical protein n=1 Tax=Epibacterium ulvae TaxID=1156985 RepID=UPI00248F82EC|nr:hypothetical protein [Epibacterium ulvae]